MIGSVSMAILLFWFFLAGNGGKGIVFPLPSLQQESKQENPAPSRQRPRIQAPRPTGSSELRDYYASNPREKAVAVPLPEKETMPLPEKEKAGSKSREKRDSSLWFSDYYTNPEGVAWTKDSNSEKILNETKKAEHLFSAGERPEPPKPAADSLQPAASGKPLHVEFWESPVHYKGYKINGNNLILFGINPSDSLRFERHPNGVWMYHAGEIYLLEPSSEFSDFKALPKASPQDGPVLKTLN